MQGIVSTAVKARIYLNRINLIEEAILDTLRYDSTSKSNKEKISELLDLLRFCEREEGEIDFANAVLEEITSNGKPHSSDIVKLNDIIYECKNELASFVDEAFKEETAKSMISGKRYEDYFTILKNYVSQEILIDKKSKKKETQRIIYEYPGHYITSLYKYLRKKFGERGLTYGTVWRYINELVEDGSIITIGGPQGRVRYCFPNPKKVKDRSKYYNKYFGIEGIVKEKVTNKFKVIGLPGFFDFYVVNSSIKPGYLLVVGYNAQIPLDRIHVKAYGDLKSFSQLKENYSPKNGLEKMDVLFARRVTTVVNNVEKEEVWSDPKKAALEISLPLI